MLTTKQNLIYELFDGIETYYIGQSSQGMKRPKQHLTPAYYQRSNARVYRWIRKRVREGIKITITVLCYCSVQDLDFEESRFIAEYRCLGRRLVNCTNGGGGVRGWKHTSDTRAQLSIQKLGSKNPNYGKRGKQHSRFGKTHSIETRAKISAAMTGADNPHFGRTGENSPHFGKKHSKETRAKMSTSKAGENNPFFGKTHSDETKNKISYSRRGAHNPFFGKKHSAETRAKMSSSRRAMLASKARRPCEPEIDK